MFRTILFLFIANLIWLNNMHAQKGELNNWSPNYREYYCYGSNEVRQVYFPPPQAFRDKKGAGTAEIEVTYIGFTENARIAFEYAVGIWASLIKSDVKIRVRASWVAMAEPDVLGSASATSFYRGRFINALKPDVFYPVAMAEKIAGTALNDNQDYDITVRFNSGASWYYGTDGKTPSTNHDLVTVVLHELCHGLGMVDSFNTTDTQGSYGLSGTPVIYDTFVEDGNGRALTNQQFYTNPSSLLRTNLTGGALYFGGLITQLYNSGSRPLLYAPGIWSSGSSISHLSESATPRVHALMTPFIARGEAIHDPGLLTLSLMADLGWIHTRLMHQPVSDTEQNITSVDISVSVISDTLLKKEGVKLIYRHSGELTYDTVSMASQLNDGNYTYTLPIPSYNTLTNYYIEVSDTFGRVYSSPPESLSNQHTFFVGADTLPPAIDHQPEKFILSILDTLTIEAVITDNLYPITALIEYRLNTGEILQASMSSDDQDMYKGYLRLGDFSFSGTDTIYYRIVASDEALNKNTAFSPSSGYHKLPVYELYETVEYFFTAFNEGEGDFLLDGFSVTQPPAFLNPALHSKHPYKSSEEPGKSLDFYAMLRYPVAIDASGLFISFKEIVLVEPGEPGFPFGTEDFFDYVVVEASKDGGRTWKPLADGYDSRDNIIWSEAYNSAISGNNSTYVGNPGLYIKRTISLPSSGFLNDGDTIVIRFRLFSDPYANGWGWAVDDLFIKAIASSVETTGVEQPSIYPNPGSGRFTLRFAGEPSSDGFNVIVTGLSGSIIERFANIREKEYAFDISNYPAGFYTIIVESSGRRSSIKYILIR